jgi:hypothetical protein
MASPEWVTVEVGDESRQGKLLGEKAEWSVFCIPESDQSEDIVLFNRDEEVIKKETFGAPNSGDITADGTAVVADWREYGERTQTDIHVMNLTSGVHRSFELDQSSPLVSVSPGGNYIAMSGWDGIVRIYDTKTFTPRAQHSVLFGERLVPAFITDNRLQLSYPDQVETLEYTIDVEGRVQNASDLVDTLRYVESFELDSESDWTTVVPELTDLYRDNSNDYLCDRIANIIGEGSLSHISGEERLKLIIAVTEDSYNVFEDEHTKLVAQILADAHYRLAKTQRDTSGIDSFKQEIQLAESYATEVLPWYAGKQLLAKIYRRRARVHKQRNERSKAREEIDKLFALEEEYDVSLATDADRRLKQELI